LRRIQHRFDDLLVAGATAEHAAEGVLHLVRVGLRIPREQIGRGDEHARRANAALGTTLGDERVLERAL